MDNASSRSSVSVICPFFNEKAAILSAVTRLLEHLERDFTDWELILVNDGSTDNSLDLLLQMAAAHPLRGHLRILSYSCNQGRGHALATGIAAARNDIVVTTEIDLSWGEDIAARLVDALDAHPQARFVVASPHLPGGGYHLVPRHRVQLSHFGNRLFNFFCNFGFTMHTGMTRAYRRYVIQPLETKERGKEFHLEVLMKLVFLGFPGREIPATLSWKYRIDETKPKKRGMSSTRLVRTIATHLRFLVMADPMRYFGAATLILSLTGLIFIADAFLRLLSNETAIYMALTGMFLLLFALLCGGFAVIFSQLREQFVEGWRNFYPNRRPPISDEAEEVRM